MRYNISIHKPCESYARLNTFSSQVVQLKDKKEFDQVKELCKDTSNMSGMLKWSVMPIRTDAASLAQDLFLPTLINGVIKTDNTSNVPLVFLALTWDAATLPLRLLSLLPRIGYNSYTNSNDHPLLSYLKGKGLAPLDVEGEVRVRVYQEERRDGQIKRNGDGYKLHLTDRAVPFWLWSNQIQFSSSWPIRD